MTKKHVKHNHVTRDIKDPGICPSCDVYHQNVKERKRPKTRKPGVKPSMAAQARFRLGRYIELHREYMDRDRDILLLHILDLLESH